MKLMKKVLLPLLLLFLTKIAIAQGIAVSPDKLNFELLEGQKQQKQLVIFNTNDEKLNFNINSTNNLLQLSQETGAIKPGEQQKIIVTANKLKAGTYKAELTITNNNYESDKISLNLGVTIKAMITVTEKTPYKAVIGPLITIMIVIVGMVAYLLLR